MILRGIDFGNIFVASGTLNFFGEGWTYHRLYKLLFRQGFNFDGSTFISKTTTLLSRKGNMPLNKKFQPKEIFPDCVRVYFRKGLVLNSVGLSGPGVVELFAKRIWQNMTKPFLISFMSLGNTLEEKLKETEHFIFELESVLSEFKAPVGIQVNVSCPNTSHPTKDMIKDSLAILELFQRLNVPIDLKIGVADAFDAGINFIKEIEASNFCDCLTCSNTIPWGYMPDRIDWKKLFGTSKSPLEHLGGGGLSGKPLKPIVLNWLNDVRQAGVIMPIKAGGGILNSKDVKDYVQVGATALEIGCVSILRPWNVQGIVQAGNFILGR